MKSRLPDIEWFHAKENKMFPPELTALVRFGKTKTAQPCGYCGRKKLIRWTLLCPFKLADWKKQLTPTLNVEETVFEPCTLVCVDHILDPAIDHNAMLCGIT